jgi:hypothetical protein
MMRRTRTRRRASNNALAVKCVSVMFLCHHHQNFKSCAVLDSIKSNFIAFQLMDVMKKKNFQLFMALCVCAAHL